MTGNRIKEKSAEIEVTVLEGLDYLTETILGTNFIKALSCIGKGAIAYSVYEDGRIHAR